MFLPLIDSDPLLFSRVVVEARADAPPVVPSRHPRQDMKHVAEPLLFEELAPLHPWWALTHVADRLSERTLVACALLRPDIAIRWTRFLLPFAVMKQCAIAAPWDAIYFAAGDLKRHALSTFDRCVAAEPLAALLFASRHLSNEQRIDCHRRITCVPATLPEREKRKRRSRARVMVS